MLLCALIGAWLQSGRVSGRFQSRTLLNISLFYYSYSSAAMSGEHRPGTSSGFEMAVLLKRRLSALRADPAVMSCFARLSTQQGAALTSREMLLVDRCKAAESAVRALGRQLKTAQFLHAGGQITLAERALQDYRRMQSAVDSMDPRKRLAAVTLSIEAAETKFAMAEWRCKKAPSIGDNSFFLATMDAVNFAKRAHKNLDVLQAELSALQAFEANDRDNDTFTARKLELDGMFDTIQDARTPGGERETADEVMDRNISEVIQLSSEGSAIRLDPTDADRLREVKQEKESAAQLESEKELHLIQKQQQQQRNKRIEDDAMRAYRDIQTRIKRETERKALAKRQRMAQRLAQQRRQEEVKAREARNLHSKMLRRRWVRLKDRTLDRIRRKNNRLGHFKMALKLKLEREKMRAEDDFAKFLRKSEQVVAEATEKALEIVWQRVGPNLERHGYPCANVEKDVVRETAKNSGTPCASTRMTTQLIIPVLHVTPGPLAAGEVSLQGAVKFGNAHPLSLFFSGAQASNRERSKGADLRELVFRDFRAFDGEFPTKAECRKAHAFIVIGDPVSGDDPLLYASISQNPLAAFVRDLVSSDKCVLAMGAGHTLLARACGGGPYGKKLKTSRLSSWESGPMVIAPTSTGLSDVLWRTSTGADGSLRILHAHDSVFECAPPGFIVLSRGSLQRHIKFSTTGEALLDEGKTWVAAMRYGISVLSFSGFPFLGPASFQACKIAVNDQGADVVCIGVVVSSDGVCMASPSPWLPNVVNDNDFAKSLLSAKDTNSVAASIGTVPVKERQSGPWSVNADNWLDRAHFPPSFVEPSHAGEMHENDKTSIYDPTRFVQAHTAAVLWVMVSKPIIKGVSLCGWSPFIADKELLELQLEADLGLLYN
eukprot:g2820.t1